MTSSEPLAFLADIAAAAPPLPGSPEKMVSTKATGSPSPSPSPITCTRTLRSSSRNTDPSTSLHMHIPRSRDALSPSPPRPLKRSGTSNSLTTGSTSASSAETVATGSKRRSKGKKRSSERMRAALDSHGHASKREEVKQRARQIKTIDNSPVNQQQLLVLRIVFDQITMYPTDAWMDLLAVVIGRTSKQVKNWFSNERPKHKDDSDIVCTVSPSGERLRLRSAALQACKSEEWTDEFFESVVMIHNFRIHAKLQRAEYRRRFYDC